MSNPEYLSYDSTIPMAMWFDKKLEPAAVKLYAFIRGLSNKCGYCFATNEYLAELMNSTSRGLQKWLVALKTNGYLEIETERNGIHWQRRIYISDKFKKGLRREPQFTPPRTTVHPPTNYSSPITNPIPNEEYLKETPPTPSKGECVRYGKFVSLTKEEFEELRELMGSTNVLSELIKEMNDWMAANGKKPYKDYAAALRNWWRKRNPSQNKQSDSKSNKEPSEQLSEGSNRNWWSKWRNLAFSFIKEGLIHDGSEYVSFAKAGVQAVRIYYRDPKFQEICENELRKIGLLA